MIRRLSLFVVAIALLYSCSPIKRLGLEAKLSKAQSENQNHIGFALYDLEEAKFVYEYNSDKYFTPASNTKIFTFYTSLRIIGDSVPALQYITRNDSLTFWGTGDPSFLYNKTFSNSKVYDFLINRKEKLFLSTTNFYSQPFGAGWAWDDYNDSYSSERSPFPVYGNFFTVEKTGSMVTVLPDYFDQYLSIGERREKEDVIRDPHSNNFKFFPGVKRRSVDRWEIPMKLSQDVVSSLLADTLHREITNIVEQIHPLAEPVFSVPADSLYKTMMQQSDNFIAEQLLLICAGIVRDSLMTEIAINCSMKNFLYDLPDKPKWVDGSGLSRYNLMTPRSIVMLWKKIYDVKPREELFPLLAIGGKTGTLRKWYAADQPYIFGKTGTLSNNHSLSGYLVTKSGKTLIFSFMNNNYLSSVNDVRSYMQSILYNIYQNYK